MANRRDWLAWQIHGNRLARPGSDLASPFNFAAMTGNEGRPDYGQQEGSADSGCRVSFALFAQLALYGNADFADVDAIERDFHLPRLAERAFSGSEGDMAGCSRSTGNDDIAIQQNVPSNAQAKGVALFVMTAPRRERFVEL
ncbi:hypothetical protein ACFO0A_10450 [Novosphingobium tardum]|uniref:Uncharacterized protein n=1 Tax=Novosphingobium tardum TaxID=1538021 RepID=A0ABV8RRJ0_9SPHN